MNTNHGDVSAAAAADQAAAAEQESAKIMRAIAEPGGGPVEYDVAPKDWQLEIVDRHNAAVDAGRGRTCPHVGPPQPYYAAAWLPGVKVCGRCAHHALKPVDEVDNSTCDRCLRYQPDRIALSALQAGMVIFYVGLCPRCRRD